MAVRCSILAVVLIATAAARAQEPLVTNSIGMELVLIHPGTMTVGRFQPPYPKPPGTTYTAEEYQRASSRPPERTPRPDSKSRSNGRTDIGKYEVTQAEWRRVMGTNPSVFQGAKVTDGEDRHPVESVTWADAQAFVRRLNSLEKTTTYRLPTEFEWEYAARAGADDDIAWSAIRQQAIAGYNAYFNTHVVGEKKPNAWGLYDTLGNVWEWVQDYYDEKIFADPVPPRSGRQHVLKGGGFAADVKNATYSPTRRALAAASTSASESLERFAKGCASA